MNMYLQVSIFLLAALLILLGSLLLTDNGPDTEPGVRTEVAEGRAESAVDAAPNDYRAVRSSRYREPPTAPEPAARTGDLRVVVRWSNGAAAVGIRIAVAEPSRHPDCQADSIETDDQGIGVFRRLRPGAIRIRGTPAGSVRSIIRAGAETTATFDLDHDRRLKGRIVSHDGEPVPGATLLVSTSDRPRAPLVPLIVADADGTFDVRGIGLDRTIAASANGHGPSPVMSVRTAQSGSAVELRLSAGGARINGLVTTSDDYPVPGARVIHRPASGPTRETRTREDGSYSLEDLADGDGTIVVLARGFAPHRNDVGLSAIGIGTHRHRLEIGTTIAGRITAPDGTGIADAVVACRPWPKLADLVGSWTRSTDSGAYRLEHLSSAPCTVSAASPSAGNAQRSLTGKHQETVRWDPVLERGPHIIGRIIRADGSGLPDMLVQLVDAREDQIGPATRSTRSGPDGRFLLNGAHTSGHTIQVFEPLTTSIPIARCASPVAGPAETVIVVQDGSLHSSRVRGRLLTDSGEGIAATLVVLHDGIDSGIRGASDPSGRFHLGPYPSARFVIAAEPTWGGTRTVFEGKLAPDAEFDMGNVIIPSPCLLSLRITTSAPSDVNWRLDLRRIKDEVVERISAYSTRGAGFDHELKTAAGRYRVTLQAPGLETRHVDIELAPGEHRNLTIAARQVRRTVIRIDPSGEACPPTLRVQAVATDGNPVLSVDVARNRGRFVTRRDLPLGRYEIVVTNGNDEISRTSIVVQPGNAPFVHRRSISFQTKSK